MTDVVQLAADLGTEIIERATNGESRPTGQKFTPPEIARFIAAQPKTIPTTCRLLDAGAGTGILTAAVCERIAKLRKARNVTIEAWENSTSTIPALRKTLNACKQLLTDSGHTCECRILSEDFVFGHTDRDSLFPDDRLADPVDLAILNPPYFKLPAKSPYAEAMNTLYSGQPNIYAAFMALVARRLSNRGEMVAITPRSFCNGLYFRGFRKFLLSQVTFRRVHVFNSRKTFNHESVLQELVITTATKAETETIEITSSEGGTFASPQKITVDRQHILPANDPERMIRLPVNDEELRIVELFDSFPDTFASLGLAISTGPVVDFRCRDKLHREENGNPSVPLLWMHNVKLNAVTWPADKNGKERYIADDESTAWMLVPDGNYVLLKRFTAKEEARRIVAGLLIKGQLGYSRIGLENHLNYVYRQNGPMPNTLALGVCRWMNSRLLDRYFRIINGNTQVNATEIRSMPMPAIDFLQSLGRQEMSDSEIEDVLCVTV